MMKKNLFGRISIRWKIFAYLILFSAVLLILLWLFQTVFLENFYKYIKHGEVRSAMDSIVANIDKDFKAEIDKVSERFDVCIEVLDSNGVPIYSNDPPDECIIHRLPRNQKTDIVRKTLASGELSGYYDFANLIEDPYFSLDFHKHPMPFFSEKEVVLYGQSVSASDGTVYVVLVNSMLTPVSATVGTIRIQLLFVSVFMIAFSVLLAVMISKNVSRPILKLNDSAKTLAKGKYDVSFEGDGFKEVSELSETLNYAAVELSKVDELRRDLIANISHDLRTPLTLIKGYSEAMRDLPDENNAENAQIIIDEAQRLSELVNDALDLSKFQSGTQSLTVTEFDLSLLLKDVAERFGKLVCVDGYEVVLESTVSVNVCGDEILISRVIYNLLINAVNYTGGDKKVVVRQYVENKNAVVEVVDSGKGISQEELPYIWDKYYKSAKDKRSTVEGTGLGLSIVRSVIELHKGKYGVRSGSDCGSIFWFSLPFSNMTQNNS